MRCSFPRLVVDKPPFHDVRTNGKPIIRLHRDEATGSIQCSLGIHLASKYPLHSRRPEDFDDQASRPSKLFHPSTGRLGCGTQHSVRLQPEHVCGTDTDSQTLRGSLSLDRICVLAKFVGAKAAEVKGLGIAHQAHMPLGMGRPADDWSTNKHQSSPSMARQ